MARTGRGHGERGGGVQALPGVSSGIVGPGGGGVWDLRREGLE